MENSDRSRSRAGKRDFGRRSLHGGNLYLGFHRIESSRYTEEIARMLPSDGEHAEVSIGAVNRQGASREPSRIESTFISGYRSDEWSSSQVLSHGEYESGHEEHRS